MQKKIELLAPAGNMEALKAAVSAGCNAVYLGGTLFSARAFAGNFNHEELQEAVEYCHIRNVKVYVTMNTLMFETEIDNAMKEVDFLYNHDVDALLVQDLGLFHRIQKEYPDFELHCSTQMHIHNANGCQVMKAQGASRVVVARETPIEVIEECCKTGVEIEVFAYGALCISYSGQCLMSQSVKNRSGNRGMCAQMCRLRYYPCSRHQSHPNADGDYVLSPKDLNVIDRIPELIEAGVSSLKIEGRMKRPEYVWLVTRTFREAIDAYYAGKPYHVTPQRDLELRLMFNRGFTQGHIFHQDLQDRMSHKRPNHQGVQIGVVERFDKGRVLVKLTAPLYQHDGLRILNEPIDTGLTAVRIWKNDLLVNHGDPGEHVWLECHAQPYPKKGQPLLKTSDTKLLEEIRNRIIQSPTLSPVSITYRAQVGAPLRLTATDEDGITASVESDFILQAAKNAPLAKDKIEASICKAGTQPYEITAVEELLENVFMPVSAINETRRILLEKLSELRKIRHTRLGHHEYVYALKEQSQSAYRLLIEDPEKKESTDTIWYLNAENHKIVVDENDRDQDEIHDQVISQIGSLNHPLKHVIAGMNLNIANSYALAFILSFPGIEGVILSSELTDDAIQQSLSQFEARYGFVPHTYRLVYGRRALMYIKDDFMNDSSDALLDLQDRVFPLSREKNLRIVQEHEVYHQENKHCFGSYVIFTDETEKKKSNIQEEAYEELFKRI